MPNDRQYEFVYVLAPTVSNAEVETLRREMEDQIAKLGGAAEKTDLWGRRKLAYPIGNFTEGIYVVQLIRGPGTMVTELERRMRVHDDVLRYLTVRVDDDLRKARRAAEKRKADAERRRAARGQEEPPSPPAAEPADGSPAKIGSQAESGSPAEATPAETTPAETTGQPSASATGDASAAPSPAEEAAADAVPEPGADEPEPRADEEQPSAPASDEPA